MNIWFKSLCFLFIILATTYLFSMIKKDDPTSGHESKYYLVDVTYRGGCYDDEHYFSMMMTGEEVAKTYPWDFMKYGAIEMGGYSFMVLIPSCEATKAEYEKFRDKLDSVCSEILRMGYPYLEELEEDIQEQFQEEMKARKGKYYLVETNFRPGGETVTSEYTFQMMLTDKEMEAWKVYKPWRPTNHTDGGYYNYEQDYPYVSVFDEVTKQEYEKLKKYFRGFGIVQYEVMSKIKEVLSSERNLEEGVGSES